MAKLTVEKGATDVSLLVKIRDSSGTDESGLTGLAYNSTGLTAYYARPGAAAVAITLATLALVTTAHTDGGFIEIDATNMPGVYRLDLPDACFATGVRSCVVTLKGATNMGQVDLEIDLQSALDVGTDNRVLVSANTHSSGQTIAGIAGTLNQLDDLNNVSETEVNAQCDIALTDYDAATGTEIAAVNATIAALNDLSFADILRTQLTEAYAADGAAPTLEQAIFLIQQAIMEYAISGTTLSIRGLDGVTQRAACTLDSATDPTSRTRSV